jgi:hypothetical protein
MITIHPRSYYIGTTAERVALVLPEDAAGAHFLDTDLSAEYFWDGTAWISGTAGASTFLDLLDTPDSYVDEGLKGVRVNAAEEGLEFSTDLPDHDHEGDPGDGGVVDHGILTGLGDDDHTQYLKEKGSGGTAAETPEHAHQAAASCGKLDHGLALDGLLDNDHTQYLNLTGVARLRSGVVTVYADPDDAFTAADTSGDVILVPPGTWTLSDRHTVAAGVSIAGVGGPAEACILSAPGVGNSVIQLSSGTGVIQSIKIVASLTAELGTMSALVLNTGNVARNVIVDWTVSAASGSQQGAAIYAIGGEVYQCFAYTHASGSNCHAIGILSLAGTLYFCYGWAELTSGSGVYVTGLFATSTTPTFHCQFEAGGILGSRYGAYIYAATNYLYHCQLTGATADLYVYTNAVAALYATKYTSTAGAGTITHLGGDRAGLAKAETVTGAWTFDENVAVAASKTVDGVDVGSHVHTGAAGQGSKLDHGLALDGLADDDHAQYLKEKASGGTAAETPEHTHQAAASCGKLDHGLALNGLGDDDHTIYLLASGARTGAASQTQKFTNNVYALASLMVGRDAAPDQAMCVAGNIHIISAAGVSLGFIYSDGNNFGLLNNVGSWVLYIPNGTQTGVFPGSINVGGSVYGSIALGCRAYRSNAQSISNNAWNSLSWDTELWDTMGGWAIGSPTRLTAQVAGYYMAQGNVQFDSNATGNRALAVVKNGNTFLAMSYHGASPASVTVLTATAAMFYMAVGEYIEIFVFQNSGAALGTSNPGASGPLYQHFNCGALARTA